MCATRPVDQAGRGGNQLLELIVLARGQQDSAIIDESHYRGDVLTETGEQVRIAADQQIFEMGQRFLDGRIDQLDVFRRRAGFRGRARVPQTECHDPALMIDLDHVAVLQEASVCTLRVDEGPVGAVQVDENRRAVAADQQDVVLTDIGTGDRHVIVVRAPDAKVRAVQRKLFDPDPVAHERERWKGLLLI